MVEQFANNAISVITLGMSSTDDTATIQNPAPFPTVGQFRFKVENELMLVTNVVGSVFSVTRGIEGTVAASHPAYSQCTLPLTAGSLLTLRGGVNVPGPTWFLEWRNSPREEPIDPATIVPLSQSLISSYGDLVLDNSLGADNPLQWNMTARLTTELVVTSDRTIQVIVNVDNGARLVLNGVTLEPDVDIDNAPVTFDLDLLTGINILVVCFVNDADVGAAAKLTIQGVDGSLDTLVDVIRAPGIAVAGRLIPPGGSTGAVLTKLSDADYDVGWIGGGGPPFVNLPEILDSPSLRVSTITLGGTVALSPGIETPTVDLSTLGEGGTVALSPGIETPTVDLDSGTPMEAGEITSSFETDVS